MKITKERVHLMATMVIDRLQKKGLLEIQGVKDSVVQGLERTMTEELSIEDRLNIEVRNLLKQFELEFEQGRADYHRMFLMVKSKLVRERGLVL